MGCKRTPEAIPESPPDAVETVLQGLSDNQPQVLWDALPPSYQADIRKLIAAFCVHMDAEIYDRTFHILVKAGEVMRRKKEYLFNSPMTLDNPLFETSLGLHWEQTVGILDTIAESDLAPMESLRQLDPGTFLASTGSKLMNDLEDLASLTQRSPDRNPWAKARQALEEAQIGFVKGTNNQGFITLGSSGTDSVEEVEMTQVEGRWVPSEMATTWQSRMSEVKGRIVRLSGPEFQKVKPIASMVLGSLEGSMDSLLKAGSQKEFDDILRNLGSIAGLVRSLSGTETPEDSEEPEKETGQGG